MASQLMNSFLGIYPGSQINFNLDENSELAHANIQTLLMGKVFMHFPEVLLLVRSYNENGKALYTFVVDGPFLTTEHDMVKIVHIAITDETPEGLAQMFSVFKDFNPCWPRVCVFLVDPYFNGAEAISKAFPSAEVVLSAFHVCKYFKENICRLSLPNQTESLLLNALKNAMCSATKGNLRNMHIILHQFLKPHMLEQVKLDWLLVDRIWALHRWRNWAECLVYFHMMDYVSGEFSQIFSKEPKVEDALSSLLKCIQVQTAGRGVPNVRPCGPQDKVLLAEEDKTSTSAHISSTESEIDTEGTSVICESLNRICIPAAFDLCLKELSVAQKSLQLIGKSEDGINVQFLENLQEVSWQYQRKCTCPFYNTMKLPCRHILTVLNANQEVLTQAMLEDSWWKQTQALEFMLPVSTDTLKIMKGDNMDMPAKKTNVDLLTDQITRLLSECSDDVFQRRYSTLRELADAWIGPYEQVKL
ncbi:zinc finger SWIM domain-containing protein 1 [Spea bombifrons]|uniref:zinc finger SWIM domain-containing protein 1 n=1 Tax=Spea bombifrons TaxID=233779 RepID=UPI002349EE11|nr:zinc finger SWIM domain-containing protein 1 [Spea bombifrons]